MPITYKEVTEDTQTGVGYEVYKSSTGCIEYKKDGRNHRTDGPARLGPNRFKAYFINGVPLFRKGEVWRFNWLQRCKPEKLALWVNDPVFAPVVKDKLLELGPDYANL